MEGVTSIMKTPVAVLLMIFCILLVGLFPCGIVRADPGWTTTEVVSRDSRLDSFEPSLDVDLDGMVHIAWTDRAWMTLDQQGKANIYYRNKSRRVDWDEVLLNQYYLVVSTESTTEHDPFLYGSGRPSLSIDPYDPFGYGYDVYIAWEDFSRLPDSPDSSESLYNPLQDVFLKVIWRMRTGDYWSPTMLVTEYNDGDYGEPSVDVGPDGVVHIAWKSNWLYYRNITFGAGFSEVELVATTPAMDPSLGVGPDGKVHIAWRDKTDPAATAILYRRYEPGNGWTTTEVVSEESTGISLEPSLAVGHDGNVHIAWCNMLTVGASSTILYRRYEPGNGWTTTEVVSTEGEYAGNPSLGVPPYPSGKVHIAWYDATDYGDSGDDTDIFYRQYSSRNGWTTTEVVSTESTGLSLRPSLAVGPDGVVHIAWEDNTNLDNDVSFPDDFDIFYKSYKPAWWFLFWLPPGVYFILGFGVVIVVAVAVVVWYWRKKRRQH